MEEGDECPNCYCGTIEETKERVSVRSVTLTQNQIWFILRAVEGYRDEILYDLTGVPPTPEQQEEIDALGRMSEPYMKKDRSVEELLKVIKDLLEWSENMGGWDAACWERARKTIEDEDEIRTTR